MHEDINFLRLLYSSDEQNILLALEIARAIPSLQAALAPFLAIHQHVHQQSTSIDTIEPNHILSLNQSEIYWEYTQLKTLPSEILDLPHLEELGLQGNLFSEIPSLILQSMPYLKYLCFTDNQLTSVSPDIQHLSQLQKLILSDNQISELPGEIGHLKHLDYLSVDNNQLTQLPEEISQLTNLECLIANRNAIAALPRSIGKLKNLKYLYLDGNQLTKLPEEIGQLTNLEQLSLQDNALLAHSIPQSIEQLPHLHTIYFCGNPNDYLDIYLPNCSIHYGWNDNPHP